MTNMNKIYTATRQIDEALIPFVYRASWSNGYQSPTHLFDSHSLAESNRQSNWSRHIASLGHNPDISCSNDNLDSMPRDTYELTVPERYTVNLSLINTPRFCRACMQETAYYRESWEHCFYQTCHKHGSMLISECSSCKAQYKWNNIRNWRCKCGQTISQQTNTESSICVSSVDQSLSLEVSRRVERNDLDIAGMVRIVTEIIRPLSYINCFFQPASLPNTSLFNLTIDAYRKLYVDEEYERPKNIYISLDKLQTYSIINVSKFTQTRPQYLEGALSALNESNCNIENIKAVYCKLSDIIKTQHLAEYLGLQSTGIYGLVKNGFVSPLNLHIRVPADWIFDLSRINDCINLLIKRSSAIEQHVSLLFLQKSGTLDKYNCNTAEIIAASSNQTLTYSCTSKELNTLYFNTLEVNSWLKRNLLKNKKDFTRKSAAALIGVPLPVVTELVRKGYFQLHKGHDNNGRPVSVINSSEMKHFLDRYFISNSASRFLRMRNKAIRSALHSKGIEPIDTITYSTSTGYLYERSRVAASALYMLARKHGISDINTVINSPFRLSAGGDKKDSGN